MRLRSIVACCGIAPLLIAASEPVRLQPSMPWAVDYAENSCRLVRTFGEGADQTKLVLESIAPGDMSMMVVGRAVPPEMSPFGGSQIKARFIPGQDDWFFGTSAQSEQGQPAALWAHVPLRPVPKSDGSLPAGLKKAMDEARARAKTGERPPALDLAKLAAQRAERQAFAEKVTEVEMEGRAGHQVILETGPLGDAVKVFDQCMRDLVSSWGVDPNIQDKIVRPAWTRNIAAWFSPADYPTEAQRVGQESVVSFRLLIDATGAVTKCESFSPYDAPQFNSAVCNVLKRGHRFAPAELADGTKVPSYYTDNVVFRLVP